MSAHTPGPWKVSGLGYVVARDDRQTIICEPAGSPMNPSVIADMHLIAAAPDLLDALLAATGAFDALKIIGADKFLPGFKHTLDQVNAAIAKAEGKP